MKSGFIGMLLVFGLILPAIFLGGGSGFFNLPSLIICIFMPFALALASAGSSDLGNALRAFRCFFVSPRETDLAARNAQVLRDMISYAYAAGVIGSMIGWIQILRASIRPENTPLGFAVSILTILYAIIISECILRPAARRIEGELQKGGR